MPPASAVQTSMAPPSSSSAVTANPAVSQAPSPGDVLAAALIGRGKDGADEEQGIARWFSQAGPPPAAGEHRTRYRSFKIVLGLMRVSYV